MGKRFDDDYYSDRIACINFSCDMVLSMKKLFFGTGVNMYVEDAIIRHLLTCSKCREIYTKYAKEVGYSKFDVIKYAIQFVNRNKELKNSQTMEYLSETMDNKKFRVLSSQWTRAANTFDIDKLMNLKAFRDLCFEYNSNTGMDYSDFMKYVILKLAKRIDHLECCLLKTEENKIDEKSK